MTAMEWLFPTRAVCVCCGDRSGLKEPWLCDACRDAMAEDARGNIDCDAVDGAAACFGYAGIAGELVQRLKYDSLTALVPMMAERMADCALENLGASFDAVTFVPMPERRRRKRGFNQGELLAQEIAARIGVTCAPLLRRTRDAARQVQLTAAERRVNLIDAFAAEPCEGQRILLCDDVRTTGSTARACASALRVAGARSVELIVFCAEDI